MRPLLISLCLAGLLVAVGWARWSTRAQQQQPAVITTDMMPVRIQSPPSVGSLLCSAGIGIQCGTTKADYVGPYKLNLKCDSGFYDPIYGGTCWSCPADTDGKGDWIRSATAVTKDDACWRIPKERTTTATKVSKTSWAWECPSGSFWDLYQGGGCWKCPSDHPRRTLAPVYAGNACATPMNETKPAIFLAFNGCPKPNAAEMKLKGKRLPGKPFLDIAGGWNQGVASGGCYACPVTDDEGNILVTERNLSPIYGENKGCDILFKWKPGNLPEPGLAGIAGMKDFIIEAKLLEPEKVNAGLAFLAETQGMSVDSPQAREWIAKQWQGIARAPYQSEAFRSLLYQNLLLVAALPPGQRSPAQARVINAFEEQIRQRRIHIARMGLAMYDAWKTNTEKAKQSVRQSQIATAMDYGTVPLDFHGTLGAAMSLGGVGIGAAGAITAAFAYSQQVEMGVAVISQAEKVSKFKAVAHAKEIPDKVGKAIQLMSKIPVNNNTNFVSLMPKNIPTKFSVGDVFRPLKLFKGTAAANSALAGAAIITVVFAVIQSVAIDQFIEIQTARPKLEAALAAAQQPITVQEILAQQNGADVLLYHWSKTLEADIQLEERQLIEWAVRSHQQAVASNYQF